MLNILYITCLKDIVQLEFSLKTLKLCTDLNDIHLTMIVDDSEIELFQSKFKLLYNIEFIKHSELFSLIFNLKNYNFLKYSGWHKQLLLKLIYSKLCKFNYYFIVDSDIIFYKKFDEKTLFYNNKYKHSYEMYPASDMINNWIKNAEDVLNFKLPVNARFLTTAPLVFDTKIASALIDSIDVNWYFEGGVEWSEYTLYSVFAHKLNMYDKLYTDECIQINTWDINIWHAKEVDQNINDKICNKIKEKFNQSDNITGFAFVIQSYILREADPIILQETYKNIYNTIYDNLFKS